MPIASPIARSIARPICYPLTGREYRPAFLGASGLWGFTASPTPQYAHFGRATNKAGALASGRGGAIITPDGNSVWTQTPANEAAVLAGTGLFANRSFTNKLTARNLTPDLVTPVDATAFNALGLTGVSAGHGGGASTGLFGIVDDSAAIAAAGLANISNGRAYSISLGGAVGSAFMIFEPQVGNTNPHSWGMWARCTGANAILRMVGSANYGEVTLTPSANYQFVKFENFTPDATARLRPQIPFGGTLLLIGQQLLEQPIVPNILIPTTAATTVADNTTIPDWQAFVERYSLLNGLTIDGTLNIDRLSAANNRTIFQAGSANEFARLDFTTGNRFRMRLIKGASPAALFTGSQQGVWYDFSDLSTMFQDAAGTVPVTAPGQPVGRVLDKSGNGNHATQSTDALRPIYQIDANGKPGIQFDGSTSNRFLVTGNINFSASDKMLVAAGVRKLSDATAAIVAELTASLASNNGSMFIGAPPNSASFSFGFASKGTNITSASQVNAAFVAPVSSVLTGLGDIGADIARLRVNGQQVAENTGDQGAGNYSNAAIYIGRRGGATLPFNGFIHQLVVRGGALPGEAELLELEEWIGIRSGVEVGGLTLESGAVSATGLYDISARFKPGDYALTVSGGVAGDTDASAETLPDAIRTNSAYVGRDIAGSLHWNGNIPSLVVGRAA